MDKWIEESEPRFRYQLLDRLRQDCEYYLGNGDRSKNSLWAKDEKSQIQTMMDIWKSFPDEDKPEWLTWEQIIDYAQRMGVDI